MDASHKLCAKNAGNSREIPVTAERYVPTKVFLFMPGLGNHTIIPRKSDVNMFLFDHLEKYIINKATLFKVNEIKSKMQCIYG